VTDIFQRREFLRSVGVGVVSLISIGVASRFQHKLPSPTSGAQEIVTLDALPIGANYNFIAKDGTQAVLFRTQSGVYAYSRICTHQGCTVNYDSATKLLQCPCHGAEYDPTQSAKVVGGPAPTPLAKINVAIRGQQVVEI
jgi:Rieske Fe-S protein